MAATFGVAVSFSHSDFDTDLEVERVREAVAGRPDFLAITAVSATGGSKAAEIAYRARVPLIYANTIPAPECFRYCLAWTGPDDWAQTRALAAVSPAASEGRAATPLSSTFPVRAPTTRGPGPSRPSWPRSLPP